MRTAFWNQEIPRQYHCNWNDTLIKWTLILHSCANTANKNILVGIEQTNLGWIPLNTLNSCSFQSFQLLKKYYGPKEVLTLIFSKHFPAYLDMSKNMWTPEHHIHEHVGCAIPKPWVLIWLHSSRKPFCRIWVCLRELMPIQSKENLSGQVLMSDEKAWLTTAVPFHLKSCSVGLRSELDAGHWSSSTSNTLYGPQFEHRGTSACLNKKLSPQCWKHNCQAQTLAQTLSLPPPNLTVGGILQGSAKPIYNHSGCQIVTSH